jgi:hypothetical protein
MGILREKVSHVLTQCGNGSGRDSIAIIPPMSAAGIRYERGYGCGKPPGPARGRGSPPGITTAIAVNRPMTTLVVMTAFGSPHGVRHPSRTLGPLASSSRKNAAPRIVGQVALRVQRDRASKPQESQAGHVSSAGVSFRPAQVRPGTSRCVPPLQTGLRPCAGPGISGAGSRARGSLPGYPLTSGPARSIETLMTTRRSRSMAAR